MNTAPKKNARKYNQVVVGLGEVGTALREVLVCDGHDPFKKAYASGHYDVMHVAFPYNQAVHDFKATVDGYKKIFTPDLVIVHSTVPIGTSREVGAVHSPIRGVHPHIAKGIRTFVKCFGGERAEEAALIFQKLGIKTYCTDLPENTEAGKLWDTTQYGIFILLNKEIYAFCEKHRLDPEVVYAMFNATYNDGYAELGRHEVLRPYLKNTPGPIGGHCVVPNARLLESPSAKRIIEENKALEKNANEKVSKKMQPAVSSSIGR